MVYDFDGLLTQKGSGVSETIWSISSSETEFDLEDRPALIRGRKRSDGLATNEVRSRSVSAGRRRITPSVSKLVTKSKIDVVPKECREQHPSGAFEGNGSTKVHHKQQHEKRGSHRYHNNFVEEDESVKCEAKHVEAESNTFALLRAPSLGEIDDKSDRGSSVSSVVSMLGRVLSPRRLSRRLITETPDLIHCAPESPPKSPRRLWPTRQVDCVPNALPPCLVDRAATDDIPSIPSETKATAKKATPLKSFSQRAIDSLMRNQIPNGKINNSVDVPKETNANSNQSDQPTPPSPSIQASLGILRASSHRSRGKLNIENDNTLTGSSPSHQTRNRHSTNLDRKESINNDLVQKKSQDLAREQTLIRSGSERGTRSTIPKIEINDDANSYSRTVTSLISPRRKVSRKLRITAASDVSSAASIRKTRPRRQSETGSRSGGKTRGRSIGTNLSRAPSETKQKPQRRFSECSGTSTARSTSRSIDNSLHSDLKPSIGRRSRSRTPIQAHSDHVARRSSSRRSENGRQSAASLEDPHKLHTREQPDNGRDIEDNLVSSSRRNETPSKERSSHPESTSKEDGIGIDGRSKSRRHITPSKARSSFDDPKTPRSRAPIFEDNGNSVDGRLRSTSHVSVSTKLSHGDRRTSRRNSTPTRTSLSLDDPSIPRSAAPIEKEISLSIDVKSQSKRHVTSSRQRLSPEDPKTPRPKPSIGNEDYNSLAARSNSRRSMSQARQAISTEIHDSMSQSIATQHTSSPSNFDAQRETSTLKLEKRSDSEKKGICRRGTIASEASSSIYNGRKSSSAECKSPRHPRQRSRSVGIRSSNGGLDASIYKASSAKTDIEIWIQSDNGGLDASRSKSSSVKTDIVTSKRRSSRNTETCRVRNTSVAKPTSYVAHNLDTD
jgi:hypothetical protein